MRISLIMLAGWLLLSACAPLTERQEGPTVVAPPITLAAPAGTSEAVSASLVVASTTTVPPLPTPTRGFFLPSVQAPAIITRFPLLRLPGEGRAPSALAQLGDKLYVANRASHNIAVLEKDKVVSLIPTANEPIALAVDSARKRVYAATYISPTIILISDDAIARQTTLNQRPNALALNGDALMVALEQDSMIEVRDANTLEKRGEVKLSRGFGVNHLVVDAPRRRLYASVYENIVALDLDSLQELFWLNAPFLYRGFAVNPQDGSLWVGVYESAAQRSAIVGYAADGKELGRIVVGTDLEAAVFDNAGRLYVLDSFNNKVYVIDVATLKIVASTPLNEQPNAALYDPMRRVVYVANSGTDNLSVIDSATWRVRATIPFAPLLHALAANPLTGRVYAANGSTNSVFVIEGDKVIGEVSVGNNPVDLALDPPTHRLFVASHADGMLTVVDERTLQVVATEFITHSLSTVAADPIHRKLFAGSLEMDLDTFKPTGLYLAKGLTLQSLNRALFVRVNPILEKIYAFASNGVPGSNARITLYRFPYGRPEDSMLLGSSIGGTVTAMAIDPVTNNLFATSYHPLAFTYGLDVFNGIDQHIASLPLGSNTIGLVVNPDTYHLFLSHARTYQPHPGLPPPRDDTIEILDTRSLGKVAFVSVAGAPGPMTILNNQVYVAGLRDGYITILADVPTALPPSPTPTMTPSPYPTWTPTSVPTLAPRVTYTSTPTLIPCAIPMDAAFRAAVNAATAARLGCPTAVATMTNRFAFQPLENGLLFDDLRDENAKRIYALFPNGTYRVIPDTWHEGAVEQPCRESVPPERYHPKRGFGTVWCQAPDVRAMGFGLREETAMELLIQPFERGQLWLDSSQRFYILFDDGTWE